MLREDKSKILKEKMLGQQEIVELLRNQNIPLTDRLRQGINTMLRTKSNQISLLDLLSKLGVSNQRINNILYYKQLSDAQLKQAQELVHALNEDIHLKSYIDQKIRDNKINVDAKQFYNEMRVKINSSKLKAQLEGEGDKKFEQMTNLIYYLSEE